MFKIIALAAILFQIQTGGDAKPSGAFVCMEPIINIQNNNKLKLGLKLTRYPP